MPSAAISLAGERVGGHSPGAAQHSDPHFPDWLCNGARDGLHPGPSGASTQWPTRQPETTTLTED